MHAMLTASFKVVYVIPSFVFSVVLSGLLFGFSFHLIGSWRCPRYIDVCNCTIDMLVSIISCCFPNCPYLKCQNIFRGFILIFHFFYFCLIYSYLLLQRISDNLHYFYKRARILRWKNVD